jgi:hypothetical protein
VHPRVPEPRHIHVLYVNASIVRYTFKCFLTEVEKQYISREEKKKK